jgi:predicted site-specific integrase-resolvase
MKRKATEQDVVDIIEAAKILGVSAGTLRRRVADGTIKPLPTPPLLKQPRKLLFYRSDIEALLRG